MLLISNYETKTGRYIRKTDKFNHIQMKIFWVESITIVNDKLARNL